MAASTGRLLPLASMAALLLSTALAQPPGQPAGNAPINICSWAETRAAVIRDTLFIDGGQMYLQETNFNPWSVSNQISTMYYFNYTVGFKLSDNLTTLFTNMPQGPSLEDSFRNGYMFADDYQLWTYGGLPNPSVEPGNLPSSDYIFGYKFFTDDPSIIRPVLGPSGTGATLPPPVTRYLTNGAGVNVPGEKSGFYFSGMTNANGHAYDFGTAQTPAATLLQIDMTNEQVPKWNSSPLHDQITPRADAELVWLPVGTNGTLLVIGGVVNPAELFTDILNSTQINESATISPTFMTEIAVYDIANGAWYLQNISGSEHPLQLTQFCSVMVSENGSSSYQIYIHGGYNGILGPSANLNAGAPNDNVWVLSVPSFTWTKVSSGTTGRQGHFCTAPYPDQMFVIGGIGFESNCVDSIIKIFNLNTLTWQTEYDPSTWSEYKIPDVVASAIAAHPTPSWSDPGLETLFSTNYNKNTTIFYPYANHSPHDSHTAAIAGSVVAGAVCLIVLVLAILWYHRQHNKKTLGPGDSEIQHHDQDVPGWLQGVPKHEPSVTTTEVGDGSEINQNTGGYYNPAGAAEAPGDQPFNRHSTASARPGVFTEAGGGTRRVSGGQTVTPRSPRSPNAGTLGAQEVEAEERYEMEVLQSHRGSGDMGARHFFRDHHLYPLSVSDGDGRSQTSGPSYSGPSHSHSQASRAQTSRDVPSPYLMARPDSRLVPSDTELPASPIRPTHLQHTRNISSISNSFPQVSPPLLEQPSANPQPQHTRSTSEDELDALEAFHTGGPPPARPSHTRNLSSISSGINQLPTPVEELSPEEIHRQSTLLASLSPPEGATPAAERRDPLAGAGNTVQERALAGENTTPLARPGEELYSPSSYSQGSTLVGGTRSPISRKPVGKGFGF